MKISMALLADAANVTRDGKLNILGIFDVIHASAFPVTHAQMQLVLRFEAEMAEIGLTHQVEIQLMDADGARLLRLEGGLSFGEGSGGETIGLNHILTIAGMSFPSPGSYEFKIRVDGQLKAEVPLRVLGTEGPGGLTPSSARP